MKEIPHFLEKPVTRRQFLSIAGAGMVIAARQGFGLEAPDSFSNGFKIEPEIARKLANYKPVTIAHRAGNHVNELLLSINLRTDFSETDVAYINGNFYADHKRYLAGIIGYEKAKKFLSLGGPDTPLSEIVSVSQKYKHNLFFDLTLPSEKIKDFAKKTDSISANSTYSSRNWNHLDYLAQRYGSNKNIYYTVNNEEKLKRFFGEQPGRNAEGVSIHRSQVNSENVRRLKEQGVQIWTYTVNNAAEALNILDMGVDGIITDNAKLTEIFATAKGLLKPREQQHFSLLDRPVQQV